MKGTYLTSKGIQEVFIANGIELEITNNGFLFKAIVKKGEEVSSIEKDISNYHMNRVSSKLMEKYPDQMMKSRFMHYVWSVLNQKGIIEVIPNNIETIEIDTNAK